ncbi:centromere protein H (CENP-H)-domain-containing protein [Coniella lustricola]|uniref:Centromere protein H (CENP-H)-domain-containing protein n=1 Tax=Coniella lustricola TaxID=2025994 RepID=A0A2T2ZV90_9PEZI|nr:centromere protein H (CENP-H)-domain-containing protein [Coniella lustricola]
MADIQMPDAPGKDSFTDKTPSFSDQEEEILHLFDKVQKLELEVALAKARVQLANAEDEAEVSQAREQLLEAMALYNLRNRVVSNVLIANPILKSIHNSTYASPIEEDLLRWLRIRDETAQAITSQSTSLSTVLAELTQVESETLRLAQQNRNLAAEVLQLAKEADLDRERAMTNDPAAMNEIKTLEARLRASKQRWRVIKATAAGIVAGSGVDWVADAELRDVVLDPE